MRTKTLFLSAAALAAGVLSSMAQANVYSVNVVGYVNKVIPPNQFVLLANPLNDGTNTIDSLGAALPNKSSAQIWNGTGFTLASKANGTWSTPLSIPPGTGYFVKTPTGASVTNTFVGSVIIGFNQTNSVNLAGGVFSLVGSPVPIAGALDDAGPNTLNLGNALPNKSSVQTWNGNGFNLASKANGTWSTNLPIGVAEGFFVKPNSPTNWSQILQ